MAFLKVMPKVDPFMTTEKLTRFSQGLSDISKARKKGVLREYWKKSMKVKKALPDSDDFVLYEEGSSHQNMKERIELIGKGSTTALKEMKLIFGYIAIDISLDNANRAGELCNMNINEFRSAEVKPDGSASIWLDW